MLHNRKSHIGIRDDALYGCEWERKQVIICPLSMRQEIDDAMGEHTNKERHCRFIEYSGQGEAGTHNDKRMHGNRYGMQRRVVQKRMDIRHKGRLRHVFQIMGYKAQG